MDSPAKNMKVGIKWTAFANVIGNSVTFVVGVILARILTPKEFGVFALSEIMYNLIFIFWNLGINSALVQKKDINNDHLNVCFTLSLLMGFMCYSIGFFAVMPFSSFFNEPLLIPIGRIVCLTFIIYSLDRVPTALLDRNLRFKERSIAGLLNSLTYGFISIPLALNGFGVYSFAWGVVGRAIMITLAKIMIGYYIFPWRPKLSLKLKERNELLLLGMSLTFANFSTFLIENLQRIVPGKFLGPDAIGYLSRSSNLSTILLRQISASVANVLLPGFSKIQDSWSQISDWLNKFLFFTYLFLAPPMFFFIFFPDETILGIFGEKWRESITLLPWLAGATLFSAPTIYFDSIFKSIGKSNILFCLNLLTILVLATSLFITVKISLIAVSIALCISALFGLVLNIVLLRQYKIISFYGFARATVEPIFYSFFSATFSIFSVKYFSIFFENEIIDLFIKLIIFLFILSLFFLYRISNPYVSYLGFNLIKIVK